MLEETQVAWPSLDETYTDEFGEIDPEVYAIASQLWAQAERLASQSLNDPATKRCLLLKAAAAVTRQRRAAREHIHDLHAYLFTAYKRLLLYELEKLNGQRQRAEQLAESRLAAAPNFSEEIERKILIQQLLNRLDDEMRLVFQLRIAEHTFEEIARRLRRDPHVLRTKFNKQLARLRQQLLLEDKLEQQYVSRRKISFYKTFGGGGGLFGVLRLAAALALGSTVFELQRNA